MCVNKRLCRLTLLAAGLLVVTHGVAAGQDSPAKPRDLRARLVTTPPKLDGVLDDEAWTAMPEELDTWMSYNPLRGQAAQQHTQVWVAYDAKAIYFAFKCLDAEPGKIKTSISRRDTVWNDDWVGVSLDSSRAGQIAYHMFINPSGIQMDALQSRNEDTAVDWLWQSAGRVDADGWTVEVRLPLESIRFRGGQDVRMGVLFYRRSSRLGASWSWPAMDPGEWVFENHAQLSFGELHQPRLLDVIPSATLSRNDSRPLGQDLAGRTAQGGFRRQREIRHHVDDHARRDHQSRLQPGGERRLRGRGQQPLSSVLQREAPVLHGGTGSLQPGRHGRRRHDADGGAYAADRGPACRGQADRHLGPLHLRDPVWLQTPPWARTRTRCSASAGSCATSATGSTSARSSRTRSSARITTASLAATSPCGTVPTFAGTATSCCPIRPMRRASSRTGRADR